MIAETIPALAALSPDDKILLAAELWQDAVSDDSEASDPNPALIEAIQERLAHYRAHPDEVSTWNDVRKRLSSRNQ
ncbi:addiction module protein [Phragmitibacter flavus]|uniref:addiction module protein n=1 Tax=Phragmitibacter flavus TaxID=2576071 RepID=UPI00140DF092|nr:addiction module protein [Phragmitibacter flavus]